MNLNKTDLSVTPPQSLGRFIAMLATVLVVTVTSGQDSDKDTNSPKNTPKPEEQQESPIKAEPAEVKKPLGPLTETEKANLLLKKDLENSPFFKPEEEDRPDLYVLRAGDKIRVRVYGEDDLDVEQTIDSSGTVNLELIEFTRVAGLTVRAAKAHIKEKYELDFLNNANVSITVVEKAKRRFVVLGQVRNPGYYEVPRSLKVDIFQAIALAGGYTRIAGKVTIKRTTSQGQQIIKHSLRKLRRRKGSEVPLVAEDDTIIVGESLF